MGCPTDCVIGDNLVFSIVTHDPDTGIRTVADAAPEYWVYEDETAVAILNGNMALLDAGNTTCLYTELIACTAGNGFEAEKNYTIYVEAMVDSDPGGIAFAFKVIAERYTDAKVNAQVLDVLNVDTYAEPGQGVPPAAPTIREMVHYPYKKWRNKRGQNGATKQFYNDAGVVVDQKRTVADNGVTYSETEVDTGP